MSLQVLDCVLQRHRRGECDQQMRVILCPTSRDQGNVLGAGDDAEVLPKYFGLVDQIQPAFGAENAMNQIPGQGMRHKPSYRAGAIRNGERAHHATVMRVVPEGLWSFFDAYPAFRPAARRLHAGLS